MNRKLQPALKPIDPIYLIEPEILLLPNNIKLIQFNTGTQELVKIELIFQAGSWFQEKNFVAFATNLMLREGSLRFTSQQIADTLDFYGAHLESTAEKDTAYLSLYSLNKHLAHTIPVLEEIAKHAIFPEHEFTVFSGKQRQMLQVNMEKVNFIARSRFNSLIYGKLHPYGNYLTVEDIEQTAASDLVSFHRKQYHSSDCTIMIAGKIEPEITALLSESFGGNDWSGSGQVEPVAVVKQEDEKKHFQPKEGASQSAIRIGRILFNKHHPDYMGMKVLNTLLGGYFGSRLMTNLREDKGFTYGIGSTTVPLVHSGYFFISCEVGAEVTDKALTEIETELKRLADEKVSEQELSLVRNYMLGSFLRSIDGPFALADSYRDVMEHGLDNAFHFRMLETIKSINPDQIRDLAVKYLNPEEMHQIVVGSHQPG